MRILVVWSNPSYVYGERIERVLLNNSIRDLTFTLDSHKIARVLPLSFFLASHACYKKNPKLQPLYIGFTNPNIKEISTTESVKNSSSRPLVFNVGFTI